MAEQKTVVVDCAGCTACCHQLIPLTPSDLKRKKNWQADRDGLLKRRSNGACVYLVPGRGCSIHGSQPDVCRAFHCGKWAAQISLKRRDWIRATGDQHDRDMLDAGLRRAL
jgi:Fe-S-cluster containining protein